MPCLLQPDTSVELSCELLQTLRIPPLLVRFDGSYIPIGVFSALVVKLSQGPWDPHQSTRYRNHILFKTGGISSVELIVYLAYLEFRITNANQEEPKVIHEFCIRVRETVVETLKSVLELYEHTRKATFQLGFYCPGSFLPDGQPHFCGCLPRQNHFDPKSFDCSKSPCCQNQCRICDKYTIWFEYWKVCCIIKLIIATKLMSSLTSKLLKVQGCFGGEGITNSETQLLLDYSGTSNQDETYYSQVAFIAICSKELLMWKSYTNICGTVKFKAL